MQTFLEPPQSDGSAVPDRSADGIPLRSGGPCDLQLQNPNRYPEAGARRLRPWLTPVIEALAPGAQSFVARFVSDREMRRLNRHYRGQDHTTDVLSFEGDYQPSATEVTGPADEDAPPQLEHLGDVVIAVPTARRQAIEAGHGIEQEIQELLLHGVLHCLGHDHETDDGTMERLEKRLRRRFIDHV